LVTDASGRGIGLAAVFASLERVERALTERQRIDLMAMTARTAAALSLEDDQGEPIVPVASDEPDPEASLASAQQREWLATAMRELPAEDRVILSMRFFDGLTLPEIKRALHLPALSVDRVTGIVQALRGILAGKEGRRP
jgi:DNA-directed RNA polymerase specialized sigma24 family protein